MKRSFFQAAVVSRYCYMVAHMDAYESGWRGRLGRQLHKNASRQSWTSPGAKHPTKTPTIRPPCPPSRKLSKSTNQTRRTLLEKQDELISDVLIHATSAIYMMRQISWIGIFKMSIFFWCKCRHMYIRLKCCAWKKGAHRKRNTQTRNLRKKNISHFYSLGLQWVLPPLLGGNGRCCCSRLVDTFLSVVCGRLGITWVGASGTSNAPV